MKKKFLSAFSEYFTQFFITSGCICLLMGVLGLLLFPQQRFGYEAFFSPLIFGVLTTLPGIFLDFFHKADHPSIIYHLLNLLMIEGIVIGFNVLCGSLMNILATLLLILGIAVVYVIVVFFLYLDNRRIANDFNKNLVAWQAQKASSPTAK